VAHEQRFVVVSARHFANEENFSCGSRHQKAAAILAGQPFEWPQWPIKFSGPSFWLFDVTGTFSEDQLSWRAPLKFPSGANLSAFSGLPTMTRTFLRR
jgi:hypothetical protein